MYLLIKEIRTLIYEVVFRSSENLFFGNSCRYHKELGHFVPVIRLFAQDVVIT